MKRKGKRETKSRWVVSVKFVISHRLGSEKRKNPFFSRFLGSEKRKSKLFQIVPEVRRKIFLSFPGNFQVKSERET